SCLSSSSSRRIAATSLSPRSRSRSPFEGAISGSGSGGGGGSTYGGEAYPPYGGGGPGGGPWPYAYGEPIHIRGSGSLAATGICASGLYEVIVWSPRFACKYMSSAPVT